MTPEIASGLGESCSDDWVGVLNEVMCDYHDVFGRLRSASFVDFERCPKSGAEICSTLGYAVIGTKLQVTAAAI